MEIADKDTKYAFSQVSVLLIVIGIIAFITGVVGAIAALFACKVSGRIIFVMVSEDKERGEKSEDP